MQRGLQWFSTGGWEHVIADGELEDFGKSFALSCLTAQSRALGQRQVLRSCPVHQAKSSFSGPLCIAGQTRFSLLHSSWCTGALQARGMYLSIGCHRQLSSKLCGAPFKASRH